jgi:hypothetical protein
LTPAQADRDRGMRRAQHAPAIMAAMANPYEI